MVGQVSLSSSPSHSSFSPSAGKEAKSARSESGEDSFGDFPPVGGGTKEELSSEDADSGSDAFTSSVGTHTTTGGAGTYRSSLATTAAVAGYESAGVESRSDLSSDL